MRLDQLDQMSATQLRDVVAIQIEEYQKLQHELERVKSETINIIQSNCYDGVSTSSKRLMAYADQLKQQAEEE